MKLRVFAWILVLLMIITPVFAAAEDGDSETPPSPPPSAGSSEEPSASPSNKPTDPPSEPPASATATPTASPTVSPAESSSPTPVASASGDPSTSPTATPTGSPGADPSASPSSTPAGSPSADPSGSPSPSPTPVLTAEPVIGESLSIDTLNLYSGMKKTYGQGYIPTVANEKAIIVLPLNGNTLGQKIRVTPELSPDGPYVYGNYQFDVIKSAVASTDGKSHDIFLVRLDLPLKAARYNGTYPIPFTIDYLSTDGSQMQQTFTVQLTITDGKTQSTGGGGGPTTVKKPVILIETCSIEPVEVSSGDTVSFKLSMKNVGNREAKNIRIVAVPESNALTLKTDLNAQFLERLAVGAKFNADFDLSVIPGAQEGDYVIRTTITYEDPYGGSYSEEGKYRIRVTQPKVEIVSCVYNEIVSGGEDFIVTLTIQNTGSRDVKNVAVRYTSQDESIRKKGIQDTVTIGSLKAGDSTTVTFDLRTLPSASEGRHSVDFLCTYADTESTGTYAESNRYEVTVYQKASIGYDAVKLPETVTSGETFVLPICVYNTGFSPLYNVRGVISVDGLICSSAYLGNINPQDSAIRDLSVFVTTLSGSKKYGDAWGSFELYYEDEDGEKHIEFQSLRCTINEPQKQTDAEKLKQEQEQKEQQTLSQWWISLLVAIAVIIILIAVIVIARFSRLLRMK